MVSGYVVRKMLQYVHSFAVDTKWVGDSCFAYVKDVRWTDLQRLAFRWSDRNGAAGVALDTGAYVVRLVPKRKRES